MREAPGLPSIAKQKAALGLDKIADDAPVYIDLNPKRKRSTPGEPYPELALAIRAMNRPLDRARGLPGDELAVYGPEILGGSSAQIIEVMQNVGAQQASIFDASLDEVIPCTAGALKELDFAARGEKARREFVLKKARVKRAESGKPYGKPPKLTGKALDAGAKIWLDPDLSKKQAAEKLGFSVSHGYRVFKYLNAPPRPIFGRKTSK